MKTKTLALAFIAVTAGVFVFKQTKNVPPSDLRDAPNSEVLSDLESQYPDSRSDDMPLPQVPTDKTVGASESTLDCGRGRDEFTFANVTLHKDDKGYFVLGDLKYHKFTLFSHIKYEIFGEEDLGCYYLRLDSPSRIKMGNIMLIGKKKPEVNTSAVYKDISFREWFKKITFDTEVQKDICPLILNMEGFSLDEFSPFLKVNKKISSKCESTRFGHINEEEAFSLICRDTWSQGDLIFDQVELKLDGEQPYVIGNLWNDNYLVDDYAGCFYFPMNTKSQFELAKLVLEQRKGEKKSSDIMKRPIFRKIYYTKAEYKGCFKVVRIE